MMGAKFTKREDEIIKALHGKGYQPQDIIKVIKSRSKESIKDRAYVLGLKWTRPVEIDEQELKRLLGK
jgi:hypothetical protein